jgi:hypothetical protein
MSRALVGLVASALTGCSLLGWRLPYNPSAGAAVAREGNGYLVRIINCYDDRVLLPLRALTVDHVVDGKRSRHCELSWSDSNHAPVTGSWRYGSSPPGYQVEGCLPLQPGETYELRLRAGAGGVARFAVEKDSAPRMLDDGCDR